MRVLALDVGARRVGIAISDLSGALARPLQALMRRSREEDFAAIAAVVAEHDIELIVVGQPFSLDGTVGPQAQRITRYAEALAKHLSVQIVMWDERFTTMEAEEILRQRRSEKKRRQARTSGELDAIAAAVILQSYLDSRYLDDHYREPEPPTDAA
jgi:putative Holliday junction resolvase